MSRHKNQVKEKPKGSTTQIFVRLFKTYARPYWPALLVGILSSCLIGGAMAAVLRVMSVTLNNFEDATVSKADAVHGAAPPAGSSIAVEENAEAKAPQSVSPPAGLEEAAEAKAPQSGKMLAKLEEKRRETKAKVQQREDATADKMFSRINPYLEKLGIDPIGADAKLDLRTTMLLLGVLTLFFAMQSLGEFINRYSLKWLGARVVTDMRIELFDKLMHQSMGYFSKGEVGKLISRCTNDIQAVEQVISSSFPELCTAPIFILVSVIFIISKAMEQALNAKFILILLIVPVCIIPVYLLSRLLKRYQFRVLTGISIVTSKMQECFSGILVIKSFNQERRERKEFEKVSESYFGNLRKAILADVFIHPSMQFSAILIAMFFIGMCACFEVSFSAIAVLGFAAQQAYKPVKDLAKINASFQKAAAAAERVFEVMDMHTELSSPENPVSIKGFQDKIVYKDVSFAYSAEGGYVLSGIDLTIHRGDVIALVGQTGSGKTTMANMLARFYDPSHGSLTIDGVNLKNLNMDDFRQLVGIVTQDTFLFNTTIAENIRYGRPDATDEEVMEAARRANVTEFINQWPEGFNHIVGERGNMLSGGQKQRVAIARAILRNPPILILDEATSA
ncbi:MAG: ABC transporter ATP-binding protein, partial [Victivallales bacterium]|nr:ABC transporter ATP-binding protein [Victivallales bacterium]